MKPRLKPTLLAYSLMLVGPLTCRLAVAQVGPSPENVKPVTPSRKAKPAQRPAPPRVRRSFPVVRVRTVEEHPAAPQPRPATPDPSAVTAAARLAAARAWQGSEIQALDRAMRLAETLTPPSLDLVRSPAAPANANQPEPEYVYRQRVTLRFVREDGEPFPASLVRGAGEALTPTREANRIELDGPRLEANAAPLQVELSADWAFENAGDARLALADFPGQETRTDLPPRTLPKAPEAPPEPALFAGDESRSALRATLPKRSPIKASAAAYPTPAAYTATAVLKLTEARRVISRGLPGTAPLGLQERRQAWLELERAIGLLADAEAGIQAAQRLLQRLPQQNPQQVLKDGYTINYSHLRSLLADASALRVAYQAEAEWWRAFHENPSNPDRSAALATLKRGSDSLPHARELATQLERYAQVAQDETVFQARLRAGEFSVRAVPRIQITHHLTRTVQVRRTVVNLRIAERELLPGDQVTVGGDPARTINFQKPKDGYWNALVSRSLVKQGDTLRITRKTETSELVADASVTKLDPYNDAVNTVARTPMRLTGIHSFAVTPTSDGDIHILEELASIDREDAKLEEARKLALKDAEMAEDGSWWVRAVSIPVSVRLRPSPFPVVDEMRSRSIGNRLESFYKRLVKRDDRNRRLLDRVIVDAIRLEAPTAGQVAGVRVGSTDRSVEDALGGRVPPDGTVVYLDGGLLFSLRDGQVTSIEIRRDLKPLLGHPIPETTAGQVVSLDYAANRLRMRTGPGLQPPVGSELLVVVAGRTLPIERDGDQFRAVVLDTTANEVNCKLVRKDKRGKIVGDARLEILGMLPPGESAAVSLRAPGLGD